MLLYDNYDDCKSKLLGTIIYYKGQAVYVKDVTPYVDDPDTDIYKDYHLRLVYPDKRSTTSVKLSDKDLNYMTFNIGYANMGSACVYFYRKPLKQYKQGLKQDQVQYRISNPAYQGHDYSLNFTKPVVDMLEQRYPSLADCASYVKSKNAYNIAFNKNFALSYDEAHEDYILEYKGKLIGHTKDFKNVNLIDKFAYLRESLMEALG